MEFVVLEERETGILIKESGEEKKLEKKKGEYSNKETKNCKE